MWNTQYLNSSNQNYLKWQPYFNNLLKKKFKQQSKILIDSHHKKKIQWKSVNFIITYLDFEKKNVLFFFNQHIGLIGRVRHTRDF